MAIYKIFDAGPTGYRAEAAQDSGMLHVCGGLATQADAEMWVAAHKRATEAEAYAERRPARPTDC